MSLLQIETQRLRLRPVEEQDLDALHRLWTDPRVRRYLWDNEIIPIERARAVIAESRGLFAARRCGFWLVSDPAGGALAGFGGIRPFGDTDQLEILYGIEPNVWGRGLATEVARALLDYGFRELGLGCLWARTDAPNAASIRVMEKCGMRFESRAMLNGLDTISYRLLRDEYLD